MRSDAITRRVLMSTSLYHKVRRRLYHRTSTKQEVAARRARFYRDVWEEAAAGVGGSVTVLGGPLLEIRVGDVLVRTRANVTSLDDSLAVAIAEDKPLVYHLLAEHGIPVPRHSVCAANDLPTAWAFVGSLCRPCVIKPARGTSGAVGITTGITRRLDLARAMAYAGAFSRDLVLEELVEGDVYRLLYFEGELLDAVRRAPPTVLGDGHATIEQLIAAENERRLADGIEVCQSLVKIDQELTHTLRLHGRTLHSVPDTNEVVLLKNVVNDNRRDDNISAMELLCANVRAAGADAAAAVGARLTGVDLITRDPSLSLGEAGGVVIEVNAAPGYYYHYFKRDGRVPVASLILERLVEAAS